MCYLQLAILNPHNRMDALTRPGPDRATDPTDRLADRWAVARCSEALRALRIEGRLLATELPWWTKGMNQGIPGPLKPNMTVVLPAFFPAKKKHPEKERIVLKTYIFRWWCKCNNFGKLWDYMMKKVVKRNTRIKYNVVNYFTLSYPILWGEPGWRGLKQSSLFVLEGCFATRCIQAVASLIIYVWIQKQLSAYSIQKRSILYTCAYCIYPWNWKRLHRKQRCEVKQKVHECEHKWEIIFWLISANSLDISSGLFTSCLRKEWKKNFVGNGLGVKKTSQHEKTSCRSASRRVRLWVLLWLPTIMHRGPVYFYKQKIFRYKLYILVFYILYACRHPTAFTISCLFFKYMCCTHTHTHTLKPNFFLFSLSLSPLPACTCAATNAHLIPTSVMIDLNDN